MEPKVEAGRITIQNVRDPDKIIEVDAVHFRNVLSQQHQWVQVSDEEAQEIREVLELEEYVKQKPTLKQRFLSWFMRI